MSRKAESVREKLYYTSFEVARILGVTAPTVVNWANAGLLTVHRTPGNHRRIAKCDILAFARENDYPIPTDFTQAPAPAEPAPSQSTRSEPARADPAPSRSTREKAKILLVDDDPVFASQLRTVFLARGYDVEVAGSGFAAGLTVARFQPQVIVLDILMPEMDGFQVLKILRDSPITREVPVVACTAFHDARIESRVRRDAFVAYVRKSESFDQLLRVVDRALLIGDRAPPT